MSEPRPRVRQRAPRVLAVVGCVLGLLDAGLLAIGADLNGAEGLGGAAPLAVFAAAAMALVAASFVGWAPAEGSILSLCGAGFAAAGSVFAVRAEIGQPGFLLAVSAIACAPMIAAGVIGLVRAHRGGFGFRRRALVTAGLIVGLAALGIALAGSGWLATDRIAAVDGSPWKQLGSSPHFGWDQWSSEWGGSSLAFVDRDHGWMTVRLGNTLSTTDGGRTWRACAGRVMRSGKADGDLPRRVGQLEGPLMVACTGPRTIWLVFSGVNEEAAERGLPGRRVVPGVLVSHDRGATWRRCLALGDMGRRLVIRAGAFTDDHSGWLTCSIDDGTEQMRCFLLRTKDRGRTWTRDRYDPLEDEEDCANSLAGQSLAAAPFSDNCLSWRRVGGGQRAFAARIDRRTESLWRVGTFVNEYGPPEGVLEHSRTGGGSWVSDPLFARRPLYSVFFADEVTGWVGGSHAVFGTADGGEHWQRELEAEGVTFLRFCRAGSNVMALGRDDQRAIVFMRPL